MSTKSFTSLRRLSASALALLLFCVSFSKGAQAQATPPSVTASFAQALTAPTGLGLVEQTVLDNYGNWLIMDDENGALYEYPAGGGAIITLAVPGTIGAPPPGGGDQNPGIAVDSQNNLYLDGNYNNCVVMFPYDPTTMTWTGLSTMNAGLNTVPDQCGSYPYSFAEYSLITATTIETVNYLQPWAIAWSPSNSNLVVSSQDGPNFIFSLPVTYPGTVTSAAACTTQGDGNCSPTALPQPSTMIVQSMQGRVSSMAVDAAGNIYFVEEPASVDTGDKQTPLSGVYMIPAGDTNLPSDTDPSIVRVDPNLSNAVGVTTDPQGNLYISDSMAGVFLVPTQSGAPNPAAAVLLTSTPAVGQVSVNSTLNIMYVPTANGGLSTVTLNAAALGSTATGAPAATSQTVIFSFSAAVTPASFAIQEAGAATPDFTLATGGTCAGGTAYAALSSCTEIVTLSPTAAGNVSAKLVALGASGNTLASIALQGVGTGSALQVSPAAESVIGAGLITPTQVAVDANDNVYVADSGLKAIEMYPKGYGAVAATTTVGTNLVAPTGVAVDGAGDVFIADSGSVYEVPEGVNGPNNAAQITLLTGLGSNLQLAADGLGNLYIAGPTSSQVVKLGSLGGTIGLFAQTETNLTGFNTPSAVAVDQNGNLYVGDGSNLDEVTPAGVQTTLLTTLTSPPTGLAVDPSESVYVTMAGGTVRIPNVSGTLTQSAQTAVAPVVTDPTSVAIDSTQDVYIADGTAENVNFLSADSAINFGLLTSATATQSASISVLNDGNAPFNFTAFTSTPDYSATATSCSAPLALGSNCTATITFNPGPGDQGTLSTAILVQSGAANSPVGVNVTGVGVSLAASTTAVSVTNATVDGAPAAITVTPASGTGAAPTGLVTLTITGSSLAAPTVVTGTLVNGAVTITPPQLPAGMYTYAVSYQGDRTYGTSTASATVTIAVGAVALVQPSMAAIQLVDSAYPYVLAAGNGSDQPYDGSVTPFEYTYPVSVVATDGTPLIAQPVYDSTGKLVGQNYGTVMYQITEVSPTAGGTGAGTGCQPIPVAADGTAPFLTSCFAIDTSNDAIPDLETTYTVTPVYSPAGTGSTDCDPTCVINPNYASVTGTPITFTALRNPVVQISSSASSLTASTGTPATATLTLTSLLGFGFVGGGDTAPSGAVQEPQGGLLNNYSLPVQLACDGLPAYATCSFSYTTPDPSDPNSVAVGPAPGTILPGQTTACAANVGCVGPGTVVMTITTNTPTGDTASLRGSSGATFAAMFGLGLLGFAFGKKKAVRRRVPALLGLLLCCGVMAGISAISGCSTTALGTSANTTVTPAGTYAVSITAKQVGSRTIAATPGIVYGNENQMSLPFTVNVTIQ